MSVTPASSSSTTTAYTSPTTGTSASSLGGTGYATPTMSSPGIGSGLDVQSIVSQLMTVESQPLNQLAAQEASYQAELTAFGSLSGALSSFQSALGSLTDPTTYQTLSAMPADATVLGASAASGAAAGTYAVTVNQLAQAQTISAAGQSSTTAAIGSGATTTLTFQFGTISGGSLTNGVYTGASFAQDGSQPSGTVTIDSTNDSLQGIRDAINAANLGVTATIVNDGSASPYHLVLTSNKTGAASSMKITVSGDATLQGLLSYDPTGTQNLTQTTAAQDASLSVNGISVTSASNTVTGAIQGVTLNLLKAGGTSVSVAQNTNAVQRAVQSFVSAYNALEGTLSSLTAYDPSTQQGGPLLGDFTVQTIQGQIANVLGRMLPGAGSSFTLLSQIGVSLQKDGTLALDTGKLQSALAGNFNGVAGLLASAGSATDSLISYVSAGTNTQAGTYSVNVSALATQGRATGSVGLGSTTTITAGSNDQLDVSVDGVGASITLAPGSYTPAQLAAQLQSAINGASAISAAGAGVSVSVNASNQLVITSNRYGSSSSASVTGGTAEADVFGPAASSAFGTDVAGTIDGLAGTGSGQYVTGAAGSAVDGLEVQVTGGTTGARGTVSYTQGYASLLNSVVSGFLGTSGLISNATDGINATIKNIDGQRADWQQRLALIQQQYMSEFTSLDQLMTSMNTTSAFLTQQLNAMTQSSSSGSKSGG
ncbi:MAG: flagellar filament capping protein FliD [Betaproteobacteria bacterium]|nr:flagellar filament capping protein FliD [Betaproteobacteria bacterium]